VAGVFFFGPMFWVVTLSCAYFLALFGFFILLGRYS